MSVLQAGLLNQSSAQVIDGSLKFDQSKSQHLTRTFSAGNRRTWTHSSWVRQGDFGRKKSFFMVGPSSGLLNANYLSLDFDDNDKLRYAGGEENYKVTSQVFRDTGWYHVVWTCDTTEAALVDRTKIYVNGELITDWSSTSSSNPTQNFELPYNENGVVHRIGTSTPYNDDREWNDAMSQVYFIDGQALGPEYFGYTDPLTNTWRPKKYTGSTNDTTYPNDINTNFSSNLSASSGFNASYPANNAFDGNLESFASSAGGSQYLELSSSFSGVTSLRIQCAAGSGFDMGGETYTISGTGITSKDITTNGEAKSLTSISLTSTTISGIRVTSSSGLQARIVAIEINGIILKDNAGWGLNGFYLPFDGNSPIGQDKSGKGNNWTPVNFGGSNTIEKATGALPILNTDGGGKVARVGTRTDENASSLVLALPLVGISSDVSNQINSGSTTKTITANGNASASSAQSNFYGGSYYFDGTGDFLRTTVTGGFGNGDFTMEFWYYKTADSGQLFNNRTNGDQADGFDVNHNLNATTSNLVIFSNATVPTNKWIHVAFVRNSGTFKRYIDGVETASASNSTNFSGTTFSIAGNDQSSGNVGYLTGYMQDFRTYVGVAKYTSNFIPASTNPDILPDTPSGVSGSSKLTKITEGAVAFDGSGDYLSITDNGDFTLDGDFTVECFFNLSTTSGNNAIFGLGPFAGGNNTKVLFRYESSGNFNYYIGSDVLRSRPISKNSWYHLAVVRNSNVVKIFLNGTQVGADISHSATISGNVHIGSGNSGGSEYNTMTGFISNFRIIKDQALYTADFTPPTRELTNVTNTKLLCCQSNTSTGAAAVSPNISGINDGTVWSERGVSNGTFGWGSVNRLFDGDQNSSASSYAGPNLNSSVRYTFPSPITGTIRLFTRGMTGNGNKTSSYTLSDGSSLSNDNAANATSYKTFSNVSNITYIDFTSGPYQIAAASEIEINGVALLDPVGKKGDAAATNFNPFTTDINTVRGQETGYCTWNPLTTTTSMLFDGNLLSRYTSGAWKSALGTIRISSGKWYWENQLIDAGIGHMYGIALPTAAADSHNTDIFGVYAYDGTTFAAGAQAQSYASAFSPGDIIGVALDLTPGGTSGTLTYYKNGVSLGVAFSALDCSKTYFPWVLENGNASTGGSICNFGQKPFKFPPPDGFQPLNVANVRPETVIARPDQYVGITTWTGTGAAITRNLNTKPDFVWIKSREDGASGAYDHRLFDSVRGLNGETGKAIYSSANAAEGAYNGGGSNNDGAITAIPKGFAISTSGNRINENGVDQVAWCWKAGGNKNTFNVDDVGYASASDVGMDVGGKNSAYYNQTSTWSSGLTNSGVTTPEHIFNGVLGAAGSNWATGTYAYSSVQASGGTLSGLNLPTGKYRIRAYSNNSAASIKINGGNTYTAPSGSANNNEWWDITETTITSIEWIAGTTVYVSGIECDGRLLLDNGTSIDGTNVLNVPSIANTGASVGTKQGFSIIKYAGSGSNGTLAHGLSQAPDFFFGRDLEDTSLSRDWIIYHKDIGATGRLKFTINSTSTSSVFFQDLEPTDKVINVGTSNDINSTNDYILYCWHDVPGLQKFGKYSGNGSDNGAFIECGFKPAIIWTKAYSSNSDNNNHWIVHDTTRDSFNPSKRIVYQSGPNAELNLANAAIDILSNGFKLKADVSGYSNYSGWDFVYCAWAEAPTFNLYGGQSNAR